MSKAIYVLDAIPDSCAKCPVVCDETYGIGAIRPKVCPLKEMPERETRWVGESWEAGHAAGWNACLDKIGGEEE